MSGPALAPLSKRRSTGVYDAIVIGGGLVGSAIAYGLRNHLDTVAVLDEGDTAYRASRGNFGLVWVQSKGLGMAPYSRWTLTSRELWPEFAGQLQALTGLNVALDQRGGLHAVLSEAEFAHRQEQLTRLTAQPGAARYPWKMLDRHEVADLVPGLGPDVRGASWTPVDATVNPLILLRALHTAFAQRGVDYLPLHPVKTITFPDKLFTLHTPQGTFRTPRLVLAAGLGNAALATCVGLHAPVRPQRGQILVLERTRPLSALPFSTLRQMNEGTWLLGDSQEEAGLNDQTPGLEIPSAIAQRAVRILPALRHVRMVRTWSALRVMSPDGFPLYDESPTHPGAFLATCHSGVTLAAAHALQLAPMLSAGGLSPDMAPFSCRRLNVPPTA
ncbi:MAG: NAD(P)/FAD-dependent oxidoreductase [Burkholderiaceae bacterium]